MIRQERVAAIRTDLKNHGFPAKAFKIKGRASGYSDAIDIEIKDLTINKATIDSLVEKYREQRYCDAGIELDGCNFYVSVRYAQEAIANARLSPIYQTIKADFEKFSKELTDIDSGYEFRHEDFIVTLVCKSGLYIYRVDIGGHMKAHMICAQAVLDLAYLFEVQE